MIFLFTSVSIWSQTITETRGWLESAFVKWSPVSGATAYNVYYTGVGQTNVKIDSPLIRSYGSYFRADILGLAAGTYTVSVKPVISGVERPGTTTGSITVLAHDRSGFAFQGGRIPGAYNLNGTIKANAVILYITQNTKNTVSLNVTGASANPCVGLQTILDGFKRGNDPRPLAIRLIGNITDLSYMVAGDIVIENKNLATSSITFEGVGADAVANGWGLRIKTASNIEVRNLGFMLTNAVEGDNVSLQQNNDHVWVHNCDLFYGVAGGDADQIKGDGAMDAKKSTYITFSYNHFWDSGKCNLLGLSENTTTGLYITYHHNWYDHSDSRHPRVRFYSAHVYNNYYDGNSRYGAGSTLGSSVFMEGNFFRNCRFPMLTSRQGTDIFYDAAGGFSGEAGGTIKSFNNVINGATRYIPYNASTNPIEFDAVEVTTRSQTIPSSIKSKAGLNTYNNFDTNAAVMYAYTADSPALARDKVIQYSGRVAGGDLKYTFNNAVDDISSSVNTALQALLTNYSSSLVYVQGENPVVVSTQTLTVAGNSTQTVIRGAAMSPIVYTWGGVATDATVTGIPAAGVSFVKNTTAKTITISGAPTANVSFSITTSGSTGTGVTLSGNITLSTISPVSGDKIHNVTTSGKVSAFYAITGNINSTAGAQSFDGLTLTARLKMESATRITFTTTATSSLILVFNSGFTGTVKLTSGTNINVNTTTYTAVNGIVNIPNISVGTYTISKGSTTDLYYIKTSYNISSLGLAKIAQSQKLTLYPNPANNQLYIDTSDQKIENVAIYNLTGALVKMVSYATESIDVSDLKTGNYIVKITTDQNIFTHSMIKK
jgi:pectate lyase